MQATFVNPVLAVYVALFLVFLYGPFLVLAILSFQTGPNGGPQFPIIEWSTYCYRDIFGLAAPSRIAPLPIRDSLARSLRLAMMTMVASSALGVLSAQRFRTHLHGSSV